MNGTCTPAPIGGEREAIAALQVEVRHLTEAVERLDGKVGTLSAQANRWKGAFLVILALGGVAGSALTFFAKGLVK